MNSQQFGFNPSPPQRTTGSLFRLPGRLASLGVSIHLRPKGRLEVKNFILSGFNDLGFNPSPPQRTTGKQPPRSSPAAGRGFNPSPPQRTTGSAHPTQVQQTYRFPYFFATLKRICPICQRPFFALKIERCPHWHQLNYQLFIP